MNSTREGASATIQRLDYAEPAFFIDTVDLSFDLDPAKTRVLNRMRLRRNPAQTAQPLRLDGEDLNLSRVLVNGVACSFKMDGPELVLENLPEGPEPFDLEIFTTCAPNQNSRLMGLYISEGTFFTQCEAQGFRRITYFLDRPDVMASYSVTLRADRKQYPVLLSNGNLVEQGPLDGGRHYAKWVDPHKKPCYLFALVAGQLVAREQRIRARSGSEHLLQIYVRSGDLDKTEHAMNSLMASIAWDEARFGLPLDLERFMIVATADFNMGAMENKGLNIFNTKYVLAKAATATDTDHANVESVVAHEYFHNWTGNRVTCRDWFQLSLKEGLTVFRDQEFSMDMCTSASAKAVKRIEDVRLLRTVQFTEDAGPMAHPVRPDSYVEINNFYTVTIYEKGAELVRMMQTLLGEAADTSGRSGFARGMALYFARHDGQAVTCDDFAQAMADANPNSALTQHLTAFKRWYSQAGTPRLSAQGEYDAAAQTYRLTLRQSCPPSPGQTDKLPFVIPVSLGLLSASGAALGVQQAGQGTASDSQTLVLTEAEQSWVFTALSEAPVPSLLRGFSAPVLLHSEDSDDQLLTRLAHDSDPFNRWDAGQQLALRQGLAAVRAGTDLQQQPVLNSAFLEAMRQLLRDPQLDPAFKELALTLPSENYMAEQLQTVDPQALHAVREAMRQSLAEQLHSDWVWAYQTHLDSGAYRPDSDSAGRRALCGMALSMLCLAARQSGDRVWPGKAYQRVKDGSNMTDTFNALSALVASDQALASEALAHFHQRFADDALVIDKWFALQAAAPDHGGQVLPTVRRLMAHPDFNPRNPNRARSLVFSYCNANPGGFHRRDAAGYQFWAEQVMLIDGYNPQMAARLARALDRWKILAEPYRSAARDAIAQVVNKTDLSKDVREVVSRSLMD